MYTVFVLLNAHCAEVMIGCAFINRRAIGGVGTLYAHCFLARWFPAHSHNFDLHIFQVHGLQCDCLSWCQFITPKLQLRKEPCNHQLEIVRLITESYSMTIITEKPLNCTSNFSITLLQFCHRFSSVNHQIKCNGMTSFMDFMIGGRKAGKLRYQSGWCCIKVASVSRQSF